MRRSVLALALALLCAPILLAQDVSERLIDRAAAFRRAARRHTSEEWLPRFTEALLGSNHAKSQPAVSRAFGAIAGAADAAELRRVVARYKGDPAALAEVFDAAVKESQVWRPGRIVQSETINRLYNTLYRGPPAEGAEFRLEPYPTPKRLEAWLHEEQRVNDKIMRFPESAAIGTLPKELDPTRAPMFWLPHVEIPIEEARVLRADRLSPGTTREIVFERGGKTYVRWFVHPASTRTESFQAIMQKYGVKVEYLAMPTSSPRSLVAWNPHGGGSFVIVKTSLDAEVGELRRINPLDKGMRAVASTKAFDAGKIDFLREPMAVFPPGREFGMIVREVPEGFPASNGRRLVPGSSIVSSRPDGELPLLVDMIKRSGQPPMEYVRERLIEPLMRQYGEVTFRQGLVGEPHQQNVLLEVGRDGHLSGRVVLRDMDSYKVDVETRLRQGFGVRDFYPYPDPGVVGHGKLQKARTYYNDSYVEYVREDWSYMLSRGLKKHFPSVTEKKLHDAFDARFAAEAKKHLGIDVDPKGVDPNEVMQEFRRKSIEGAAPKSNVPQELLRQEFSRLAFNRRTLWVGEKAAPNRGHTFVLHDGAIEMRSATGKPLGFALLEPRGARNFYVTLPYPRREPDAKRLSRMYDAIDGARHDRATVGGTLRNEAKGGLQFAAAYLLKEAMNGRVGTEVATTGFWVDTGVFTGAAHLTSKLPLKGLGRAALPLAAGMAAVQLLHGQASLKDVLIDTGAFLIAGAAVNLLADGLIYPILFAAGPPGWIAAGVYTVAKLAVTLYLGEKLGDWMRGLFGEGRRRKAEDRSGVVQKVDGIDP